MELDIFTNEIKCCAAGILIYDIVNNEQIVFLGRSNIPNRNSDYEGFGGKYEKCDLTSLHTALREMIEEFFNLLTPQEFINELAIDIINLNLIIKRKHLYGMSYLINLNGLNFIFNKLIVINNDLTKYKTNNTFNYDLYFQDRIINDLPHNGLNEIKSLHVVKIKDILNKNNNLNLRWFTSKIIYEMIVKKHSSPKNKNKIISKISNISNYSNN
jgi:hypothetical protein